jgi:carbon monoxide dehydrogenase subunit G
VKFSAKFQVSAASGVVCAALADLGFLQRCMHAEGTGLDCQGGALRGLMPFQPDEDAAVYQVVVTTQEVDEDERWLRIAVRGREQRGGSLGFLTVTASMCEAVGDTIVTLDSELVFAGVHQNLGAGQVGPLAEKAAASFGARVDELLRDPAVLEAWQHEASAGSTRSTKTTTPASAGIADGDRTESAMTFNQKRVRIFLAAGVLGTTVLAGILVRRALRSPCSQRGSEFL